MIWNYWYSWLLFNYLLLWLWLFRFRVRKSRHWWIFVHGKILLDLCLFLFYLGFSVLRWLHPFSHKSFIWAYFCKWFWQNSSFWKISLMSVFFSQGCKFFLVSKFLVWIQILILDIIEYNIYRFVTVWVILNVPYFLYIDNFMISIGLLDLFQVFSLLYFLLFLHLHYHLLHLASSPFINLFLSLSILLFSL